MTANDCRADLLVTRIRGSLARQMQRVPNPSLPCWWRALTAL